MCVLFIWSTFSGTQRGDFQIQQQMLQEEAFLQTCCTFKWTLNTLFIHTSPSELWTTNPVIPASRGGASCTFLPGHFTVGHLQAAQLSVMRVSEVFCAEQLSVWLCAQRSSRCGSSTMTDPRKLSLQVVLVLLCVSQLTTGMSVCITPSVWLFKCLLQSPRLIMQRDYCFVKDTFFFFFNLGIEKKQTQFRKCFWNACTFLCLWGRWCFLLSLVDASLTSNL